MNDKNAFVQGDELIDGQVNILSVSKDEAGKRIDVFLAEKLSVSRSAAAKLVEDEDALVNGKKTAKNYKMATGDSVEVTLPMPEPSEALPENIPLDVIYEDGDIIVV